MGTWCNRSTSQLIVFFGSGDEPILIRSLVGSILSELSNSPEFVAPYIVGLSSRVEELIRLLDLKSKGKIQVLGLHGMGGAGKTTLAKALYNKLVAHFERRSFISNVREMSAKQGGLGLVSLQNKLIKDLSEGSVPPLAGKIAIIKDELPKKPVLVVLDDVDNGIQLTALIGKREWYYEGSRIIVTTRDKQVLLPHLVLNHEMYEVKELGFSDSIKLFSYHAFRREKPITNFTKLSEDIVSLTGRLPLALEVFGSHLFDKRSVEKWEDAVRKLKRIRPDNLQDVLKISFEGLDEQEKCIFLDIACLLLELEDMKIDDAIEVMEGCGFSAKNTISILIQRSLAKVREDNELWMHDQIRDMARQIVLDEDHVDAGKRSRLWKHDEILGVLQDKTGTGSIEGIVLDTEKRNFSKIISAKRIASNNIWSTPSLASAVTYLKEMYKGYFQQSEDQEQGEKLLHTKQFKSMTNLRLLQLSNVRLEGDFNHLPARLKWLQWRKCPLKDLPLACPRELAVLDLAESKIERLWGSRWWCWYLNKKVAKNLMIMNLFGCYNITSIPDLSGHPTLKKLNLERCGSLARIHKSIGDLTALRHLNLKGCSSLGEFPRDVSGLTSLETLNLSGCWKLKTLPEDMRSMKSLKELVIEKTAISKLPESIIWLTKLERLDLRGCISLSRLPRSIGNLSSLRELFLDDSALEEVPHSIGSLKNLEKLSLMRCASLTVIPDSVGNLKSLRQFWLNGSSVAEMPASIGSIHYLKSLGVASCRQMSTLPVSIGMLASIVELQLDGTSISNLPDEIGGLRSLRTLEMRKCESLRSLPETVGRLLALETLIIQNAAITELPESIGMLENLIMLNLNRCKLLSRLPASIGELKSLHHLLMEKTAVSKLPETFGNLSNLMILKMGKLPWDENEMPDKSPELTTLVTLPSSFSNLSLLAEFDAKAWKISGKIPDDFEKLTSLEILNLGHNNFCSLPSSLSGLTILRVLLLDYCKELKVLPPLPSSLVTLNAANCIALESITDLSNLESLKDLNLANCEKLVDISGLECLKSLRWLHMIGCSSCSSDVKKKISKVSLKNLHGLSMPGSVVPGWFTPDVISFSKPRNYVPKGVIIVVVVSVNHQIKDFLRDQLPVLPNIEAKIHRLDKQVFSTTLNLEVPKTDEDQVYLCRYPEHHPLVSILEDGDELQVAMKNPPIVQGVELKKSGIHLVFENDDDYDGDEELLEESYKSVSERLTNFIRSSEDHGMQGAERRRNEEQVCCLTPFNYIIACLSNWAGWT